MKLIFPLEQTKDGFSTSKTAGHEKGHAEPVVRELLQNCLDARTTDRDRVDAVLTIDPSVPTEDIPCIGGYRDAYNQAFTQQSSNGGLSSPDRNICARISKVLESQETTVLFCRDNGVGLNEQTMSRLLSEGNTSKTEGGAGSVGVGHLTAYSASDLRYVLYGGQTREEPVCVSGRALLAAWLDATEERTRSAEGTLADKVVSQRSLFDSGFAYLKKPPSLLAGEMRRLGETGTVVAVLGFDLFGHETCGSAAEAILKIAAAHFLPAVLNKRMTVSVRHGRQLETLDAKNVGTFLDPQGRVNAGNGVRLPEGLAYRSWRTFREGKKVDNSLGADIRIRPLREHEKGIRVHFYRDGMWITKDAPWVTGGFGGCQPFDAVVSVDRGNDLYRLIRDSEGATHYEINQHNLASQDDRRRLKKKMSEIHCLLKGQAGEIVGNVFIPSGFAVFGTGPSEAEVVKPSSRAVKPVDEIEEFGNRQQLLYDPGDVKEHDSPNGQKDGDERMGNEEKPDIKPARPRRGSPAKVRKAFRVEQSGGMVTSLVVSIDDNPHPAVGVRVIRETGSDETCDIQLGSVFYPVVSNDGLTVPTDEYELRWEGGTGMFRVLLNPPQPASHGVPAVDLVARQ